METAVSTVSSKSDTQLLDKLKQRDFTHIRVLLVQILVDAVFRLLFSKTGTIKVAVCLTLTVWNFWKKIILSLEGIPEIGG